jgi:hypothetical protein
LKGANELIQKKLDRLDKEAVAAVESQKLLKVRTLRDRLESKNPKTFMTSSPLRPLSA